MGPASLSFFVDYLATKAAQQFNWTVAMNYFSQVQLSLLFHFSFFPILNSITDLKIQNLRQLRFLSSKFVLSRNSTNFTKKTKKIFLFLTFAERLSLQWNYIAGHSSTIVQYFVLPLQCRLDTKNSSVRMCLYRSTFVVSQSFFIDVPKRMKFLSNSLVMFTFF